MVKRGFVGGLVLLLLSVALLRTTLADETVTLDFDHPGTTDPSYTINEGVLGAGQTGDGVVDTVYTSGPYGESYFTTVTFDLPADCTVTNVQWAIKHTKSAGNIGFFVTLDGVSTYGWEATITYNTWGATSNSANGVPISDVASTIRVEAAYADPGNTSGTLAIDDIVVQCGTGEPETPDWTRPLRSADEASGTNLYDNYSLFDVLTGPGPLPDIGQYIAAPTQYRVYSIATAGGAPVMAAQAGVITDIVYASADMCSVWGVILGNNCLFAGANSTELFELFQFPIDFSVQQVTIELGDGTELRYVVANANKYLDIGMSISEGCVIGETITAAEVPASQLASAIGQIVSNFTNTSGLVVPGTGGDFGVTMIEHRDPGESFEMLQLLPNLTEYNEAPEPCNINANFQDCLVSDPDLTHGADAWTLLGDATATDAGIDMRPGSSIRQTVNAPAETNFTLRIGAYYDIIDLLQGAPATDRVLFVRVGDFTDTIVIPASDQYQEYTVEVPAPGPDPGGLGYTVLIQNNGPDGGVILSGACLATTDHELNPRMCYFANPEFDSSQGWVTSSTALGNGYIILGDAEYVSQTVTLDPNPDDSPRTYYLNVDVRPIAAPGATLNPSVGSAAVYFSWTDVETIGTLDLSFNQPGEVGYPDAYQTLSFEIEVAEHTSNTFTIYTGITDNTTVKIALSRACISTDEAPPPSGGGTGGPFTTTCATIPVPTDNEIGTWTMYHWRNLDKFFNCKLMVLLNKWFKLFDDFRRTTLLVFRWGIAFINKAVDWSITLMWWLNGHFRNIAMGQVTTINEAGGCHDIFCAIVDVTTTLGNLLTPIVEALNNVVNVLVGVFVGVASLFFTIIGGLVAFVVALIIKLVAFLNIAVSLLTGLVGAYNTSTPTAIPGLPSCALDPSANPLCIGVWVADNTIFQGRWNIIFTVLLSILSIHLILYTVREVKTILLETWSSS